MDNTDNPTTGVSAQPEGQESNTVIDPGQTQTPSATTDTPVTPPPEDNVEAIAKRVIAYMTEGSAKHLTIDMDKQRSNVDIAYGRR